MKQHFRGSREPRFVDPDFYDALDNHDTGRPSAQRQIERKTQQFCRQVQQALNFALADLNIRGLDCLFVEEVSPAPDCGRLLIQVIVPGGLPVAEVLTALARETPRLRAEVASTITRKRAPELYFVPACLDQGDHE